MGAASRLLCAPELVELILRELDHRTLISSAPRVSRQWKDIIEYSPAIQRKLFLRPETTSTVPANDCPAKSEEVSDNQGVRLQDFLAPEAKLATDQSSNTSGLFPWGTKEIDSGFTRKGASWRKMLLQQPPVFSVGQVMLRRRTDGSAITKVGKAETPEGLRLGQVWDLLRENMCLLKSDLCFMQIYWSDPSRNACENPLYPMNDQVSALFQQGCQLVLAFGFTECLPSDRFYGKFAGEYTTLCKCEEYEPLDFNCKETVVVPSRSIARRRRLPRVQNTIVV